MFNSLRPPRGDDDPASHTQILRHTWMVLAPCERYVRSVRMLRRWQYFAWSRRPCGWCLDASLLGTSKYSTSYLAAATATATPNELYFVAPGPLIRKASVRRSRQDETQSSIRKPILASGLENHRSSVLQLFGPSDGHPPSTPRSTIGRIQERNAPPHPRSWKMNRRQFGSWKLKGEAYRPSTRLLVTKTRRIRCISHGDSDIKARTSEPYLAKPSICASAALCIL